MLSVAAAGNRGRLVAATACFLVALLQQLQVRSATATATPPRAFFVFGDSLVDSGNNNYLATTARADSPPYGLDYPTHHATGRFSNGRNVPDIISEYLGAEPALPYLSRSGAPPWPSRDPVILRDVKSANFLVSTGVWPVAAAGGGWPSPACQVGMESGRKPYPALLWSGDDGARGVTPLPGGVVEDSASATCLTVLRLWVKDPLASSTTVASVDVTFLVEGVVTCGHLCPRRQFELSLSSPPPSYPYPF